MNCAAVLACLALQRLRATLPQAIAAPGWSEAEDDPTVRLNQRLTKEKMHLAHSQTWLAVEIILTGEKFLEQLGLSRIGEERALVRSIRALLDGTFLNKGNCSMVPRCLRQTLRAALQSGMLSDLGEDFHNSIDPRSSPTEELVSASRMEWRELERLGEEFMAAGYADFLQILEMRWQGREPLVVLLMAAFLRQASGADCDTATELPRSSDGSQARQDLERLYEVACNLAGHRVQLATLLEAPSSTDPETRNPADAKGAAERLESGLSLLQRGDYDLAIAEFTRTLRLDPASAPALAHRADVHCLKGDYEQALADYDAAHRLDPTHAAVLCKRGKVRWVMGELDGALADFTASLQLDPHNPVAYAHRGAASAEQGDFDAALADLELALQCDPTYALGYEKRGDVHFTKGNLDQAIADYSQVFRLSPFAAPAYIKRGDVYQAKAQYDRAIADYSGALSLDPLNFAAIINRAGAYRRAGMPMLSLADLDRASRLEPSRANVYFERGLTLRDLKNCSGAVEAFSQALGLNPADAEILYERGCTQELQGNLPEALADFDAAIEAKTDFVRALNSRGSLRQSRGDVELAIFDFTAALKCNSHQAATYLNRASAWTKKGRFDKTIADAKSALNLDPKLLAAYYLRANAYAEQGAYERARADLTRALAIDPQSSQAYQVQGVIAAKQGDYENAIADFTESLRLDSKNALTFFRRAKAYQFMEQQDRALNDLHHAVLLDPQYTAAYCLQRAVVNTVNQEFEQALTDYAITLQLDPTNVTALTSCEQLLRALQDQSRAHAPSSSNDESSVGPSAPSQRRSGRKTSLVRARKPSAGDKDTQEIVRIGKTEPMLIAKKTQEHRVVAAKTQATGTEEVEITLSEEKHSEESSPRADSLPEVEIEEHLQLVPEGDDAQPDQAVPAPEPEVLTVTKEDEPKSRGPVGARVNREEVSEEMRERARLWSEMRYRERRAELDQAMEEAQRPSHGRSFDGGLLLRRVILLLGLLAVVGILGAGGYYAYLFLFTGDIKLTAEELTEEFAKDTPTANKKYKGKFVQVTGKVMMTTGSAASQLSFEPTGGVHWKIIFALRKDDAKKITAGQQVTVRCRLSSRKEPDGNLSLTSIELVKIH